MRYLFLVFFGCCVLQAQNKSISNQPLVTTDAIAQQKWVDDLLAGMTLDQKIGQLFMVQAYSNKGIAHQQELISLIENQHIGGLIFMKGTPQKQVELYNLYQSKSLVPLLMGFDGEWGLSMRLKSSFAYPWNMTLGAVQDNELIHQVGVQIAKHCKEVGVHINFAPVVDLNTNPKNPIIGNRSFGEDKYNVTQKALAFIKGMQSEGVLANAKHFPGHGDTSTDSHKTLPFLNFDQTRLDTLELYPYQQLAKSNLASVMVAHLNVPALKTKKGKPTSLSNKVVTKLLKNKIGFKGLVFTDALNMNGVANYAKGSKVALEALKAGNDMLLIPVDVKKGIKTIKEAILNKELSLNRLESSVEKVLKAKYFAGLQYFTPLVQQGLQQRIQTKDDELLRKKVVENAITLVKNNNSLLPLQRIDTLKLASISMGNASGHVFKETLNKYTLVNQLQGVTIKNYKTKLKNYPWKSYKLSNVEVELINAIAKDKKVILSLFTSPYSLLKLSSFKDVSNVIVAYQNDAVFQSVTAQQIFGALPFLGKLPVSVSNTNKAGMGITTKPIGRLSYGLPEEVGLNSFKLSKIDSVAKLVVNQKMAPGLQVLVAKQNKIVFQKSYGYQTYKKVKKIDNNSLYDLASLTKILGAFPLYLKAYDDKMFNLGNKLSDLLPEYKDTSLGQLLLIDVFAHKAGLKGWIPFYLKTLDSITKKPIDKWYKTKPQKNYNVKVANHLYLKNEYIDSIYHQIKINPLRKTEGYKYSGLSFFMFKKILQKFYKSSMDDLFTGFFSKKIGADKLLYNPLDTYDKQNIVPSEIDQYFRYQTLQGTVHDMGAAMLGGVSGNAGLFGNTNDVAKMMQLFLNKGVYGNHRYFESATFDLFNKTYFKEENNRRGLVLDKPDFNFKIGNTCNCVSLESFGHSGFTGTYAWADPKTELIYVFLSNRTYPTMEHNALGKYNIRTEVQKLIEQAIID